MWREEHERELVRRWQQGDRQAGEEIVASHFDHVRRFFAARAPVEVRLDLIQETFMRLTSTILQYRSASRLRTFIIGIARNVMLEQWRRSQSHPLSALDILPEDPASLQPSSFVRLREQYAQLLWAMRQLPPRRRDTLELYYWQGLSALEIGEILGEPASSVRRRLSYGRAQLRAVIDGAAAPSAEQLERSLIELGRRLAGE